MRALCFIISIVLIVLIIGFFETRLPSFALDADITILDLNQQIQDKKSQVQSIKNQISIYQQSIKQREREAATLENETALLEDQISKLLLDIQASEEEQMQLDLEIRQVSMEMTLKEAEILRLKEQISAFVRQLYMDSDRDYLEILLVNNSFSDFFDKVYYLEQTQGSLKKSLERVVILRDEFGVQKSQLEQSHSRQQVLKEQLDQQKSEIDERREAKQQLIVQSLLSKEKFQQLLGEARQEQFEISSAITDLQESVRKKLQIMGSGIVSFSWPVNPSRGISAYFHDRTYPFRSIFEHSAVDIRAYQGSYVMAAEDGYVGRAKDGGKKGYSYVMILHDKGFATVYGHLSHSMVKDEMFVKKGQVIGLSGGTPGTNGAGPFTTGPHLHFEVRVNGVPDDPLKYLP